MAMNYSDYRAIALRRDDRVPQMPCARTEATYARNGRVRRSLLAIAGALATPCAAPLAGVMAGALLLQRWHYGVAAFLVLASFMAGRLMAAGGWINGLSTVGGVALYCAAVYLLLALPGRLEGATAGDVLAGVLLVFLSLITWLSSLLLEPAGARLGRAITGIALAAAIVILGSPFDGMR